MIHDFIDTIKKDAVEKYVPVSMPASDVRANDGRRVEAHFLAFAQRHGCDCRRGHAPGMYR
jgi:hypothetical protein